MNRLTKALINILVVSSPVLVLSESARANIKITLGDPTVTPSSFTFKLDFGRDQSGNLIESDEITIPVVDGANCVGKADKLFEAVEDGVLVNGQNRLVKPLKDGCMVTFRSKSVKSLSVTADPSKQEVTLEAVNKQKAKEGKIDGKYIEIATNLSGVDADGNESIFAASLGFETPSENIFANSVFSFSELGGNDIDDWLSAIFDDLQGQLPTIYQPDLSLDLTSDEITFNFPFEDMLPGGFIVTQATDTNVLPSISIEADTIPEPTSTLSFLAIGTFGAASTLKRKLKASQSTEKETTKVG